MLKTCPTCGGLHEINEVCPVQLKHRAEYLRNINRKLKRNSEADIFRNSRKWKRKRKQILSRDIFMCRVCFLLNHNITTENLSVHHIESLNNNFKKRLDDSNLISLCRYHHEMAEKGAISVDTLKKIIKIPMDFIS